MALVLANANIEPTADYVVVDYWLDGYALGNQPLVEATGNYLKLFEASIDGTSELSCLTYRYLEFNGNITATSEVGCFVFRFTFASGVIDSTATVEALAYRILFALGNITATSVLTSDALIIKTAQAVIDATSAVEAYSIAKYSGLGDIVSEAEFSVYANYKVQGYPSIYVTSNLVADGHAVGRNWSEVATSSNIWLRQG